MSDTYDDDRPLDMTRFLIETGRRDWGRRTWWGKIRFLPWFPLMAVVIPCAAVLEGFYDFLFWIWAQQPPVFKEELEDSEDESDENQQEASS